MPIDADRSDFTLSLLQSTRGGLWRASRPPGPAGTTSAPWHPGQASPRTARVARADGDCATLRRRTAIPGGRCERRTREVLLAAGDRRHARRRLRVVPAFGRRRSCLRVLPARAALESGAPEEIVFGAGPNVRRAAERVAAQREPIPIFVFRTDAAWEYVGRYECTGLRTDAATCSRAFRSIDARAAALEHHARSSARRNSDGASPPSRGATIRGNA